MNVSDDFENRLEQLGEKFRSRPSVAHIVMEEIQDLPVPTLSKRRMLLGLTIALATGLIVGSGLVGNGSRIVDQPGKTGHEK